MYIIDDAYRCRYLVGAGGTRCPVYRAIFRAANPRARALQAVTLEEEFAYDWRDPRCHLWFFEKGLPGYGWYVPKADGYLNVGIGGIASELKLGDRDIHFHWGHLTTKLRRLGLVREHTFDPKGYTYYLRDRVGEIRIDNAFLVGDAVGLATRDMAEGIGPAVRSGLMAAESIALGRKYTLDSLARFSLPEMVASRALKYLVGRFAARLERDLLAVPATVSA